MLQRVRLTLKVSREDLGSSGPVGLFVAKGGRHRQQLY